MTLRYFQDLSPKFARLGIFQKKYAPLLSMLEGCQIQKILASDEGFVTLKCYHGQKINFVLSIRRSDAGISVSEVVPPSQVVPHAFIQMARKYIQGRRIKSAYAGMNPISLFIEIEPPFEGCELYEEKKNGPSYLILDLDAHPPRLCLAKAYDFVPSNYEFLLGKFEKDSLFFESFCEWTLESTKTKRRATFLEHIETYSFLPLDSSEQESDMVQQKVNESILKTIDKKRQEDLSFKDVLAFFPTHVRRSIRTKMDFLERRLKNQMGDFPSLDEIKRLQSSCDALKECLFEWPVGATVWYVPPSLMEQYHLAATYSLGDAHTPGEWLNKKYKNLQKLKKRHEMLSVRVKQSKDEFEEFRDHVIHLGREILEFLEQMKNQSSSQVSLEQIQWIFRSTLKDQLCKKLKISWTLQEEKKRQKKEETIQKLPYRSFLASTGEKIRVSRSSVDADTMLRMMPSHHLWFHVLTGEGSHVWLEVAKKRIPSQEAMRESAILALHYSKLAQTFSGEVRMAKRSEVEKKKDLPAGKVLVRRCKTEVFHYTQEEIGLILERKVDV